VSVANGLNEPNMKRRKILLIASVFAVFQGLMPLIGWLCVHTIAGYFALFEPAIPWIGLTLLGWIGFHMIAEGVHPSSENTETSTNWRGLLTQGVATSIDALSVGFTVSDYILPEAIRCAGIISGVTFGICVCGVAIGRKVGAKLAGKASIFGGSILLVIGFEILLSNA